jgi:hypothetical protein
MSMPPLALVHVIISLIGIGSGFIVLFGMFAGKRLDGWTALFLTTTILTSVTGFIFFPFEKITPGIILGVLSLIVLGIAVYARYSEKMTGGWRSTFVLTAMIAQWFNVFVLIAQIFQKVPAANALAPTPNAPAFLITQTVVMIIFIVLIVIAVKRFRTAA